jgi:hypothetical protein
VKIAGNAGMTMNRTVQAGRFIKSTAMTARIIKTRTVPGAMIKTAKIVGTVAMIIGTWISVIMIIVAAITGTWSKAGITGGVITATTISGILITSRMHNRLNLNRKDGCIHRR